MARQESDREDLLAEAVALVRRVELDLAGLTIVAGFRATGWLSVYFAADPMYQFDDYGRLRRAFEEGFLYRTAGATLSRLTRQRSETETVLLRQDLTSAELIAFRGRMTDRLTGFTQAMQSGGVQILRQMPEEDDALVPDLIARLRLASLADPWLAPAISSRR